MANTDKPPDEKKQGDPLGERYGITHFSYDVLARAGPGVIFWCVLLAVAANQHTKWFQEKGAFAKPENWWLGFAGVTIIVLLGYFIGQISDCLVSWWMVDIFAKMWWKKYQDKNKKQDAKNPLAWTWDTVQWHVNIQHYSHDQYRSMAKAQVESRSCTNLANLLLGFAIAGGIWYWIHTPSLKQVSWNTLIPYVVMPFLTALGLYLGGFSRQGRRVWGMCALTHTVPVPQNSFVLWEESLLIKCLGFFLLVGTIVALSLSILLPWPCD